MLNDGNNRAADSCIGEVIDVLERQRKLYDDLLKLSHEKRQVICKGDTERLNEIVQAEVAFLSAINSLEKERLKKVEAVAVSMDTDMGGLTLSKLAELSQEPHRGKLQILQKELNGVLKAQLEINTLNRELLQTQIDHTDVMLNIFVGDEDPLNNIYRDNGSTDSERKQTAGLFDRQI
ncbi:MAG: flagellar protein FlgN [Oscillospiraceae bacterium]|nr:flagellar protein FlgN [Oscillospiraceae bacterium]